MTDTGVPPRRNSEFGSLATLGIAVPQANPTVEPEMWALAPRDVSLLSTRLQGSRTRSQNRLVDYLDNFAANLESFDTAPLDAIGYACTATSYLIGREAESRRLADFSSSQGVPIISSAQAITAALSHISARRIALLAPYPRWLVDASVGYWESCGFTVAGLAAMDLNTDDTRAVYQIRTADVLATAANLDIAGAEAILLTGTGMPTLRAIPALSRESGLPVISSNLALMWALLVRLGIKPPLPDLAQGESLMGGWARRLEA